MIAFLRGHILERHPPWLWLEVNGIGYELEMPLSAFFQLPADGAALTLHTHLVVREDAHLLYGFRERAERDIFRQLIKVSGIGGKVALACLSGMDVEQLRAALRDGDVRRLTAIPGVGARTAERLIVELRDKLASGSVGATPVAGDPRQEAIAALQSLGYKATDASQALAGLDPGLSVEELIRQGLKTLARH
ncbi:MULTISPECIES: Holliday junction branch migration protein RuvA [Acidithiobacillus]|jgi:Holliday junction DNA helicase RuvA|uniref:Holliday junction branch migration complex subunit RuvA n=3 Tax=Acidithiobacillus caldus TaxID=33059 RepID=F9ZTV8_ACICS|nr:MULTISPECIES: Holliday junction branch migration protein RuvA [Acidithiobacillus]AEK59442.1 Holliday junction DNA helicase RuvA [Acidithiobacillus caldus SM-1]AIA56485.1 Holliday junction DNA helicase RuvA [Acidithiobacillus caldus ATCC 51756]AUW33808.1 Holliday junction branch migration protein RuvA [Acidithiobacillus caldus]MBU2730864.1 Holliday junction branch migration protein RuvA [Acidithiobacillus caldus]MBU2735537.1 Holliday junction branch migration protein RuvA [Acidithiobacillus 